MACPLSLSRPPPASARPRSACAVIASSVSLSASHRLCSAYRLSSNSHGTNQASGMSNNGRPVPTIVRRPPAPNLRATGSAHPCLRTYAADVGDGTTFSRQRPANSKTVRITDHHTNGLVGTDLRSKPFRKKKKKKPTCDCRCPFLPASHSLVPSVSRIHGHPGLSSPKSKKVKRQKNKKNKKTRRDR